MTTVRNASELLVGVETFIVIKSQFIIWNPIFSYLNTGEWIVPKLILFAGGALLILVSISIVSTRRKSYRKELS